MAGFLLDWVLTVLAGVSLGGSVNFGYNTVVSMFFVSRLS
jgi:hypothetical protein